MIVFLDIDSEIAKNLVRLMLAHFFPSWQLAAADSTGYHLAISTKGQQGLSLVSQTGSVVLPCPFRPQAFKQAIEELIHVEKVT